MINVKKLNCSIKGKKILNDVNCKIDVGKITAIIGANGSGKSTLLKCIMGLNKYEGAITIGNNKSLSGFAKAKQITYMAQSYEIPFPHTVRDTVLMGRRPHSLNGYTADDMKMVDEILNKFSLHNLKDTPISKISGGERQKAFLASAIVQDTEYLLLDEPLNNLDPRYQAEIFNILIELKKSKAIAFVLHDISLLNRFDDVIMLKSGAIFDGDVNATTLTKLYDSEFIECSYEQNIFYLPKI